MMKVNFHVFLLHALPAAGLWMWLHGTLVSS